MTQEIKLPPLPDIEHWLKETYTAAQMRWYARAAVEANRQGRPTIAWLTRNEDGDPAMLFFDRAEAATYCADGEQPEPLILARAATDGECALWDTLVSSQSLTVGDLHGLCVEIVTASQMPPGDSIEAAAERVESILRAALAQQTSAQAACRTCGGRGWVGGPAYRQPDEGGEPCPECEARQDAGHPEWMTDDNRAPWAINSLKDRIKEIRASEKRCRNAFKKDYMRVVSVYFADALCEAAEAFERRLAAIDTARAAKGE